MTTTTTADAPTLIQNALSAVYDRIALARREAFAQAEEELAKLVGTTIWIVRNQWSEKFTVVPVTVTRVEVELGYEGEVDCYLHTAETPPIHECEAFFSEAEALERQAQYRAHGELEP